MGALTCHESVIPRQNTVAAQGKSHGVLCGAGAAPFPEGNAAKRHKQANRNDLLFISDNRMENFSFP
jgi:hypothetical protein